MVDQLNCWSTRSYDLMSLELVPLVLKKPVNKQKVNSKELIMMTIYNTNTSEKISDQIERITADI